MVNENIDEGIPNKIETTRYTPERLFDMSKIARAGPKLLKGELLSVARILISRGVTAVRDDKSRIGKIWKRLSGHDK